MISFNMHSYGQDASAASVGETLAADHGVGITGYSTSGQGWWRSGIGPLPARSHKDAENGVIVAATLNSGGNDGGFRTEPGEHLVYGFKFKETWDALGENIAPTLTHGGPNGGTSRKAACAPFGVRRLTPTECERLQGFPDGWTAWGIGEDGARVEMSDSARYRMLGNAVNRKVSAWLDSRIVEVLS